jgi:hypothetical protein
MFVGLDISGIRSSAGTGDFALLQMSFLAVGLSSLLFCITGANSITVNLNTYLHRTLSLRVGGAIPLLRLHAFRNCEITALTLLSMKITVFMGLQEA